MLLGRHAQEQQTRGEKGNRVAGENWEGEGGWVFVAALQTQAIIAS